MSTPSSGNEPDELSACEAALRYRFRDRELLRRCLTHASIARSRLESNERLEFLGDAILGLIVCEYLFHRFPDWAEGELTRVKSAVVSRRTCAKVSKELGLDRFLLLGKGVTARSHVPTSILAAVFESLVAGIYLDGGLQPARRFVERSILPHVQKVVESQQSENYKSLLQQLAQKLVGETPAYRVLDEKGPDHCKCFQVAAVIGKRIFPPAWGPSKKAAEQAAAKNAYVKMQADPPRRNRPGELSQ
ncbi:MAG TPA: ribonuclease III [Planctomycetaceae bacterium]|nr:ribonuclease III [Planctomycetaceae bacterium]